MGSVAIPHLNSGWHVDQAILSEEDRLVAIRFGRDWDPDCMRQDEVLYKIADKVKSFAAVYVCDIDQVPDFNQMYELYDPCTIMFFFRNKHIMCDFGTGNNNKLNWVLEDKQELIDILETIYRGAKKGRGLVVSPKGRFCSLLLLGGGRANSEQTTRLAIDTEDPAHLLLDYDTRATTLRRIDAPHGSMRREPVDAETRAQALEMNSRIWQRGLVSLV